MAQTRITLSPKEFKQLLESQVRFANLKHDLIADCAYIEKLFPQPATNNSNLEGLIIDYTTMYISGGYFFKYSANNPFARILPDYFKDFVKEQTIDVYSISFPQVENNSRILESFKPKYSVASNQGQFTVMTRAFQYISNPGVTFTLNYWSDPNERTPVNYFFDAKFCDVEYWINEKVFKVSDWFSSNNDIDNAELFPANIDKERKLKFKMKGLYNLNDEMCIRSAAARI